MFTFTIRAKVENDYGYSQNYAKRMAILWQNRQKNLSIFFGLSVIANFHRCETLFFFV
jgi:hypothetical protein